MIKNDNWITSKCINEDHKIIPMISPFSKAQIRSLKPFYINGALINSGCKSISYGLSSYGYDLRLSENDFRIFRPFSPGSICDPKAFDEGDLAQAQLYRDEKGSYFLLPPFSYALGVAVEKLNMPSNVVGVCLGKSTYARCGIIINCTPAEPGWSGHLTLELSNSSPCSWRIYANEGICQMLFFEGEEPEVCYASRAGKYQDQPEMVTIARL